MISLPIELNECRKGGVINNNMQKIICVLLGLLCLFLPVIIAVIMIDVSKKPTYIREEWLNLQSPDSKYNIKVVSVRSISNFAFSPSGFVYYKLEIYCQNIKEQKSGRYKYYFSTRLYPIKNGLKDENYEIEWIDESALLRFKGNRNNRKSLSFFLNLEEFFEE